MVSSQESDDMRAFPLIRNKWSNDHIMAVLFCVLLLYMLPGWIGRPSDILIFAAILALSLILDEIFASSRHKRMICSVSAAVTAAVIHVITPGIPLWGKFIGVFIAIVPGKQLWGGTGKNPLNPAMLGYIVIRLIFAGADFTLAPSYLFIPALLLSLPFALFRPFAALGFVAGTLLPALTGQTAYSGQLAVMAVFFGCIVLTDPVTVTPLKTAGFVGGLSCAFIPALTANPGIMMPAFILMFNMASCLIDLYVTTPRRKLFTGFRKLKDPYPARKSAQGNMIDLTEASAGKSEHVADNFDNWLKEDPESIIRKIQINDVYGMGGAAFPTYKKLRTVMDSNVKSKYFIINGAECDPGLIHDKWLLANRCEDVVKGIRLITRCIDFSGVILAVKDKSGLNIPDDISVYRVGDFYPAGYERFLIKSILKKNMPAGFIPAKLGILVLNVQTVLAVYEAVCLDKKPDRRYITISDLKKGNAVVAKVKTGTPVMEAIKKIYPDSSAVFAGGGVMQARMAEDTDLIQNDINMLAAAEMPRYKESPLCSKCGLCVEACPQGLLINRIAELADENRHKLAEKYSPELCIGCGVCSYVCLAGRNLSAAVSEVKEAIKSGH